MRIVYRYTCEKVTAEGAHGATVGDALTPRIAHSETSEDALTPPIAHSQTSEDALTPPIAHSETSGDALTPRIAHSETSGDATTSRVPHDAEVGDGRRPGDAHAEKFRDATTLLSYGALAGYAFWLYAYGPALALLRAELHFSYGVLGVYSALWAAGAALAGMSFAPVARRLPRSALLWSSAAGATAGAGLFTAAHTIALTMSGAVLIGFAGTTLLTCIQAILSDRHGEQRDRALTEANVGAAGCAVLAPVLLGLFQATPLGWRAAFGLPAVVLVGLYLRYRHQPLPSAPK